MFKTIKQIILMVIAVVVVAFALSECFSVFNEDFYKACEKSNSWEIFKNKEAK